MEKSYYTRWVAPSTRREVPGSAARLPRKIATIQRRSGGAGVDPLKIMKQTRHVKVHTRMGYDRRENDVDDHAGDELL